MTVINDIENFQKEFEDYVKKFEQIRELALRFKTNPGTLVEMFFGIGLEALKHTESILQKEFQSKLDELFPSGIGKDLRNKIPPEIKEAMDLLKKMRNKSKRK